MMGLCRSTGRRAGIECAFWRGGSDDNDSRCPDCYRSNSIKSRQCRKCKRLAPANGWLTRKALRELAAERRTRAILKKHELLTSADEPSPVGHDEQHDSGRNPAEDRPANLPGQEDFQTAP
jgi:hypothetical protein